MRRRPVSRHSQEMNLRAGAGTIGIEMELSGRLVGDNLVRCVGFNRTDHEACAPLPTSSMIEFDLVAAADEIGVGCTGAIGEQEGTAPTPPVSLSLPVSPSMMLAPVLP